MKIHAHVTHLSTGDRPAQEDHALSRPEQGIFIVSDGFGGPDPGARASRSACESVAGFLVREAGDLDATLPFTIRSHFSLAGNVLFNALIHANRRLTRENRGLGVHERGGASLVAGYIDGELLALANVGCCSAWLIRDGRAAELVMPRSYARLLDPFSRKSALGRDAPLTALGAADDVEPEIFEYRLKAGDWLLLHTDGLSPELLAELGHIQSKKLNTESALSEVKSLLEYVPESGDNLAISLVLL